ncbi:ceramide glucosyltransferase [Roseomonas sp. CCTCC AB2023176]|uniref:ceramide glucosyltransferase n=1 Tax=Roseomonas sp. CCTCC AB2023176 TaxID=3342640 RepID=UPI0035D807FF
MSVAASAGVVLGLLAAANLGSLALAGWRLRRRVRLPVLHREPVSIVRPVCGVEEFSEETLGSAFRLEHPDYEILFCVQREDDPVIPLVRRLIAENPGVEARLLVGDDRISGNPKLNNCVKGWEAARHEWVVLADSNVLMAPDYLEHLLSAWRADTGLICSTPLGSRAVGFPAEVECAFLNTLQARWQYAGEAMGLGFAQGKSMLWQRSFLNAHGGIRALGAEIAEDAAATKLVRAAGRHVHLVASPFEQPLGGRTLRQVWDRQVRWARLRRVTFPLFFAPELFIGAAVPMLLGMLAAPHPLAGALAVAVLWYGPEFWLARAKGWPLTLASLPAMVVRDAMVPLVWAAGWTTGRTVWRGNTVAFDGDVSRPVTEP